MRRIAFALSLLALTIAGSWSHSPTKPIVRASNLGLFALEERSAPVGLFFDPGTILLADEFLTRPLSDAVTSGGEPLAAISPVSLNVDSEELAPVPSTDEESISRPLQPIDDLSPSLIGTDLDNDLVDDGTDSQPAPAAAVSAALSAGLDDSVAANGFIPLGVSVEDLIAAPAGSYNVEPPTASTNDSPLGYASYTGTTPTSTSPAVPLTATGFGTVATLDPGASWAGLSLLTGKHHHGGHSLDSYGTSGILDRQGRFLGSHHGRSAGVLGSVESSGQKPSGLRLDHGRGSDGSSVAGSVSAERLLGSHSGLDPNQALSRVGSFASPNSLPNLASPSGGASMAFLGSPVAVSGSTGGSSGSGSLGIHPFESPGSGGGSGGSGSGGSGSGGSGSGGPGSGYAPNTSGGQASGDFNFSLTFVGSDNSGAFTIQEDGTGTFADQQSTVSGTTSNTDTGTIHFTALFHRGTGSPTEGDPSNTVDTTFDPSGSGLLLGYDLDGYNQTAYGVAPAQASSYQLSASGGDGFSDGGNLPSDTTNSSGLEETSTDLSSDSGTESFRMTIGGTTPAGATAATARTVSWDDTTTDTYSEDVSGTDAENTSAETLSETFDESDGGSDTETDHAEYSVGSDGKLTLTGFRVADTTIDRFSDTDGGSDTERVTGDTSTDGFNDSDSGNANESLTISGTGDNWNVSLDESVGDQFGYGDNANSTSNGWNDTDAETFNDSGSGNATEGVHLTGGGDATNFTLGSMSVDVTGGDDFSDGSTDNITDTKGQDLSTDTATATDGGHDGFGFHLGNATGGGYSLTETEAISDGYTDGDNGGDGWNDPTTDPRGRPETDRGSDNYTDGDIGNESDAVSTFGSIDANGNFTLGSLHAVIGGLAGTQANDGGTDSVDQNQDDETQQYLDNSTGTDGSTVTLDSGTNGSISVTTDETINAGVVDGTGDTSIWNDPTAMGQDRGNDTDVRSDNSNATVVEHAIGSIDSSGNYVDAGKQFTVGGASDFLDGNIGQGPPKLGQEVPRRRIDHD